MDETHKRVVEVRLLVLVSVDINNDELIDEIRLRPYASVAEIVASEVSSNLESVAYVDAASATQL